ncbi:MAG: hypothetical protein ACMUIP_07780 [bacterium]
MGTINVKYQRGGRRYSDRSFSLKETQETLFGDLLNKEGITSGLGNRFEIYVRGEDGKNEISAHNCAKEKLADVLRAAAKNDEIMDKTFIIDCTAEHRGAHIQ